MQFFYFSREYCLRTLAFIILLACSIHALAQPSNNDCSNASVVNISGNGFAIGTFNSSTDDFSQATIQSGETFAPALLAAGLSQKSIWYKFSIPTTRAIRVTLAQSGIDINAGDVGFAVYKTSTCIPGNAQISTKLTPIGGFGNTYHPCVDSGVYYIQVSGKAIANGQVYVQVETSYPTAAFDRPSQAYDFGTLGSTNYAPYVDFAVDCQSVEDASEVCPVLANYHQYTKSTWHVFKTPAYFDYVAFWLAGTGSPFYFNNQNTEETFGYHLYQGDARTTPIGSLPSVDGCDSVQSNGYTVGRRLYKCSQLQPNTVYSIQVFYKKDFSSNVRLSVSLDGFAPTSAPEPILSSFPATNSLGTLASDYYGVTTQATDQLGCNSQHILHPCIPLPAGGIPVNGSGYNLSTFFTFTLSGSSNVNIYGSDVYPPYRYYNTPLLMRLYHQGITNTCNGLDTSNIISTFFSNNGVNLTCLPPGDYTLQVSGRDSIIPSSYFYSGFLISNEESGVFSDLGKKFKVSLVVKDINAINHFSLNGPGAVNNVNVVGSVQQPLTPGISYPTAVDTFGCANTVLPVDTSCGTGNNKAIYRQFLVADSGVLNINETYGYKFKLYNGDANALATAQNAFTYPDHITGLTPYSYCINNGYDCNGFVRFCVVPGTYTEVVFGSDGSVGQSTYGSAQLNTVTTVHNSPSNAEDMGTIPVTGGTLTSSLDHFSCKDNAITINGYTPCNLYGNTATKAIYRQFYLAGPSTLDISGYHSGNCYYSQYGGYMTLFQGKITDGPNTLTVMDAPWRCFQNASTQGTCNVLQPGWYTIISYGGGPTFSDPFQDLYEYGAYASFSGWDDKITVTATPACPGPKYNRPYKAAIDTNTHLPFLVQWGNYSGNTSAYPKTDTIYTLYQENFNCTVDTPFALHPLPSCDASLTKVAYYVFRTTQESYVQIDTKYLWGAVYAGDARTDSMSFATETPIQPCLQSPGFIQICRLLPGVYTLVVFNTSNGTACSSISPTIYIDKVGYSRFDFAQNAYDFGAVAPDSLYHNGKTGDINPIDAGRAPSSDIIYCTTGAMPSDPTQLACNTVINTHIYSGTTNNHLFDQGNYTSQTPRRNLWYTFVLNEGGNIHVKVENKTPGKTDKHFRFGVYKSDVDGSLPFSAVVSSGQVDSTMDQGLTLVAQNNSYYYCYTGQEEITFYREPCNTGPERYYILVENPNTYPMDLSGLQPNAQPEVSIMVDSVNTIQPLFDHYFQASDMGSGLGTGSYTGATDNYSCATADATDPINYSCATKTLWYKFTTTVTGHVKFRLVYSNTYSTSWTDISLYRQLVPGDSTTNGLQWLNGSNTTIYDPSTQSYWGIQCIQPGTYYLLVTGCNQVNAYEHPEIQILEEKGDFCSAPVVAALNGNNSVISSAIIDCHTIGTDYGEFNPTLTCPNGADRNQYKTSWFRVDISGTDTLDVTTYITENTNAQSSEIKYRMMDGNCGAMQERSCVQDALTQDTYKCLLPGRSYFFQVFTPVSTNGYPVTGTIDLHLTSIPHADTCAHTNNCLSTAAFIPQFDCTQNDTLKVTNLSTYGSDVQYFWDFGFNNQTSTAVSPQVVYPFLTTSQTYTIKLKVLNNGCGGSDSSSIDVTIPARPNVHIGNDTTICQYGSSLTLDATTWPGTTYQWSTGATTPSVNINYPGSSTINVTATYNGCIRRDTIEVNINPTQPLVQTSYLCGSDSVYLNSYRGYSVQYLWSGPLSPWKQGSTSSGLYAGNAGIYYDSLRWKSCYITDTFTLLHAPLPFAHNDTTLCPPFQAFTLNAGMPNTSSYTWQDNSHNPTFNVTQPGQYWVQYYTGNCYTQDTIQVLEAAPVINEVTNASVCPGSFYQLPWGGQVNSSGAYADTIRYLSGCDSLVRQVNLTVTDPVTNIQDASICAGQTFTLPWGPVVSTPGIYKDTIRTVMGCDSLVSQVTLSVGTVTATTADTHICNGTSYTLPWGEVVSATGTYSDTLHHVFGGCDSLIRTVHVFVDPLYNNSSTAFACSGQTYTLPWGETVSGSGVYADTIRYVNGCDSLIRQVSLTILPTILSDETASICAGQTYTLPWGDVVSSAGVYTDTLHYTNGCDSLISTVNLTVNSAMTTTTDATICSGSSYTLPSGLVVSNSGIYRDTLHYITGCDSIIRVTNLTVNPLFLENSNVAICAGANYVLPWGTSVSSSGIYQDTTRYYITGCDSLIRKVNLTVLTTTIENTMASICSGQSYTLPWGTTVSSPGIYHDTLHYVNGCDSVISTVELTLNTVETTTTNAVICSGNSYLLPSGQSVTADGIYRDTLHFVSGCDSLIRITNLTVHQLLVENTSASICNGDSYTLPWGSVVNASGIYRDTIRYADSGCDSLQRNIILTVQAPQLQTVNASICSGDVYVLPWGEQVSAVGTYKDTLHFTTGCDSLYRTVNLDVKTASFQASAASICSGQSYALPWGTIVTASGIYRDTLRYVSGCDSIIRSVTLTVFTPSFETSAVQICSGQSYTLPWGPTVNISGSYHDTLFYQGGCDSVIKTINLTVHSNAVFVNKDTSICEGDVYYLPWGGLVGTAGTYRDTIRTSLGCDSIVWKVSLGVSPYPIVSVSKSNDINCNIGTSRLNASGGYRYSWTPSGTLDNAQVRNPLASPTATTLYHVEVSSPEGCTVTDSIEVLVLKDPTQFGFQLPSAFTPNGDGLNDCFGLSGWGGVTDVRFYIYNRWGELVFFTTDPSKCWDGTYKGKALGNEVFIYQVYANSFCGKIYRNGTVAVIR